MVVAALPEEMGNIKFMDIVGVGTQGLGGDGKLKGCSERFEKAGLVNAGAAPENDYSCGEEGAGDEAGGEEVRLTGEI